MTDINCLAAAIFAAKRCTPSSERDEYLREYDAFLKLLRERRKPKWSYLKSYWSGAERRGADRRGSSADRRLG